MINIYLKIIKQLKDEIFSLTDEFGDEEFVFGITKKGWIHCPILKLQKYLYQSFSEKNINFFLCINIKDG